MTWQLIVGYFLWLILGAYLVTRFGKKRWGWFKRSEPDTRTFRELRPWEKAWDITIYGLGIYGREGSREGRNR